MEVFTVTMTHTAQSVEQLSKVQYNTFHAKAKVFWYVAFFACILGGLGLFGDLPSTGQVLLIAIGGIGIMNVGASARARTDKTLKIIQAHGNHFPTTQMTISSKKITILEEGSDSPKPLKKTTVVRLVEDEQYYYIFITQGGAYMVPKEQIANQEDFVKTLEQATDKSITQPLQFKHITLQWLLQRLKK